MYEYKWVAVLGFLASLGADFKIHFLSFSRGVVGGKSVCA